MSPDGWQQRHMTAYDNRDEEHAADDDRPDFPGIVSPEMSVAYPRTDDGDDSRQHGADQQNGQRDTELVDSIE